MKERYFDEISKRTFPRHHLSDRQKKHIVQAIRSGETRQIDLHKKVFMPLLSGVVMFMIIIGLTIFSVQSIFQTEKPNATNEDAFSISLPDGITIEKRDYEHVFLKGDQVVGGVSTINHDQKQILLTQQGVIEKEDIKDFPAPTERVLIHVKLMHAIQTVHYLVKPAAQDVIYDVYFHANTPGYFGGSDFKEDLEIIDEIAKTFKVTQ